MKIQMIADIRPSQNAETGVSLGYLFSPGTEVTIGREIGNTIAPLIDSLSRHHAKLYAKDGEWFVEDLGSTNGSFLAGEKLAAPAKLTNGCKLQFGTMRVSVELLQDAGSTAQIPAPAVEPAPAAMTPAEAAAAGAAAAQVANQPTILTKPTIPGLKEVAADPGKPVVPAGVKPIEPPKTDDVPDLPPVEPAPAAKPAVPAPAAKPVAPALKPGLKLPPKPALGGGIKLPPKPALGAGIKLPPKPALAGGLKLPPKPVIKKV